MTYEARCQNCGFTGPAIPIRNNSFIARSVEHSSFFTVTCLVPCPECDQQGEWIIYRIDPVELKIS